jgi:surface antigen
MTVVFSLVSLPTLSVPTASATTTVYVVKASVTPTTVAISHTYKVTGSVSPVAPGKAVQLQQYYSAAWHNVASATLTGSSSYTFTRTAPAVVSKLSLRVVKPSGAYRSGASPTRAVYAASAHYVLTASTSALVRRGVVFHVNGSVSPAATGAVYLQRYWGSAWHTIASQKLTTPSTYSFALSDPGVGKRQYRVWKGYSGYRLTGVSPTRSVVVTDAALRAGEVVHIGEYLTSGDGRYRLTVQTDGNVVENVVSSGRALWSTQTVGTSGAWLVMQHDGNAVVYNGAGRAVWSSVSGGSGDGGYFAVQVDGNLVNYTAGNRAVWASSTVNDSLATGEVLYAGQQIASRNGRYRLVLQGDSNLVEYGPSGPLWASNTVGACCAWVASQSDGNIVAYRNGVALWNTGTGSSAGGAVLVIQDDGNVVVYRNGVAQWHTAAATGPELTYGYWPSTAGPKAANTYYGYPYPNAPQCTNGGACIADKWLMYQGQCTSWTAYRLNQMNGFGFDNYYGGGGRWGNATDWGAHARGLGIPVNGSPAVGAAAWYSYGHVAYVEKVLSPTSVVISEMNVESSNGFRVRTISTAGGWPTGFIHIHDR